MAATLLQGTRAFARRALGRPMVESVMELQQEQRIESQGVLEEPPQQLGAVARGELVRQALDSFCDKEEAKEDAGEEVHRNTYDWTGSKKSQAT